MYVHTESWRWTEEIWCTYAVPSGTSLVDQASPVWAPWASRWPRPEGTTYGWRVELRYVYLHVWNNPYLHPCCVCCEHTIYHMFSLCETVPPMVWTPLSFISSKLMELSLLRKSDPLFCPSHRPPSLSRPRIITLSSHSSPLACFPPDFQSTLSPTTLPLKQQQNILPLPPYHLMPPPTNPPLPLTISFHPTPHVCLISPNSSYTTHNASPSSLIF